VKYHPSGYIAFSLVELTLALGVAAISLLAIFGLLTTGLQINHTSIEQTASVQILTSVATDLRATPPTTSTSLQFGIIIPTNTTRFFDASGQSSTTLTNVSRYRMVVTFLPNSGGRTATRLHLRITWPAGADPANGNTRASEMFVALDRN
jgi:uncharacterized protein (TIGR02598 family)